MSDDKPQSSNSLDDIRSRYEMVMIAAKESRRLNELARTNGKELKRRVTDVAWERLHGGAVYFSYQEPEPEADAPIEVQAEGQPEAPDFAEAARTAEKPADASSPAVEEGA